MKKVLLLLAPLVLGGCNQVASVNLWEDGCTVGHAAVGVTVRQEGGSGEYVCTITYKRAK